MQYFEDFMEGIETLPNETRSKITNVRELDLMANSLKEQISKIMFHNTEDTMYIKLKNEVFQKQEEVVALHRKKMEIAKDLYDTYERTTKKMDTELAKMKMELEADHPGVTDKIEKDMLNGSAGGSLLNVRAEKRKMRRGQKRGGVNRFQPNPSRSTDSHNRVNTIRTAATNEQESRVRSMNQPASLSHSHPNLSQSLTNNSVNSVTGPNKDFHTPRASQIYSSAHQSVISGTDVSPALSSRLGKFLQYSNPRESPSQPADVYDSSKRSGARSPPIPYLSSGTNKRKRRMQDSMDAGTYSPAYSERSGRFSISSADSRRTGGSSVRQRQQKKSEAVTFNASLVRRRKKTAVPCKSEEWTSRNGDAEFEQFSETATDAAGEEIYCICRDISHGEMVCCDNDRCSYQWFHFECVHVTSAPKGKWYCPMCREDSRFSVMKKSRKR